MRVLITRSAPDAAPMARWLRTRGHVVDCAPVLATRFLDAALPFTTEAGPVTALAFTSIHGVQGFARLSARRDLPAYCVGARTAALARRMGFVAQSANGDAAALSALLAAHTSGPVLHPGARELARGLSAPGGVLPVAVYETTARPLPPVVLRRLRAGIYGAVFIHSPKSALAYLASAGTDDFAPLYAISEATAAPLRAQGLRVQVAAEPNVPALQALLGE